MADKFIPQRVLHGIGGAAWFNGEKLATLQSVEMKITGDFEDVNVCDDPANYTIYNGWTGEGTLTYFKVNSKILSMVAKAFKSGEMPDITITTRLSQKGTNKSERVTVSGVVITEVMLAKFEKKSKVEEEVPFKFSDFDIPETI